MKTIIVALFISLTMLIGIVWGHEEAPVVTKYTRVYYVQAADLKCTATRLNTVNLGDYIDTTIESIMGMLGLYAKLKPIDIVLHQTKADLQQVLRTKYYEHREGLGAYSYDDNIVHLSVDVLRPDILAHELTHAILMQNYPGVPPEQTAEILAEFIGNQFENSLWDNVLFFLKR